MSVFTLKSRMLDIIAPYVFKTKNISEAIVNSSPILDVERNDVRFLTDSTFNVIYIKNQYFEGYFRECRKHLLLKDYVEGALNDYFDYIENNADAEVIKHEIVDNVFRNRKSMRKFAHMGIKNDTNSRVSQFLCGEKGTDVIGISNDHSEKLDNSLISILNYLWGELYVYNLSKNIKKDEYQGFNSNRQIATYELAKLFGVEYLIPNTRYVRIKINGKIKFGTLMAVAPGICPEKLSDIDRKNISPNFQKEIIELNLLDLICRQTDHRPGHNGNYNVLLDSFGVINHVCAFDNDSPTTFKTSAKISFVTSGKTTPFISKNGEIDRPFLPRGMTDRINEVKAEEIKQCVSRYLTNIQYFYIVLRIKKIRSCLKKNTGYTLLRDAEWSEFTIRKELEYCSENGSISYLQSYIDLLY